MYHYFPEYHQMISNLLILATILGFCFVCYFGNKSDKEAKIEPRKRFCNNCGKLAERYDQNCSICGKEIIKFSKVIYSNKEYINKEPTLNELILEQTKHEGSLSSKSKKPGFIAERVYTRFIDGKKNKPQLIIDYDNEFSYTVANEGARIYVYIIETVIIYGIFSFYREIHPLMWLFGFVTISIYYIICESIFGGTILKLAFGMRTVDKNTYGNITLKQAIIHSLGKIFFPIEILSLIHDRDKLMKTIRYTQRKAKTLVVIKIDV